MIKSKLMKLAASLGIEVDEGCGEKWDISLYAPEGKVFSGSGCGVSVVSWWPTGAKGDFWDAVAEEMELDDA